MAVFYNGQLLKFSSLPVSRSFYWGLYSFIVTGQLAFQWYFYVGKYFQLFCKGTFQAFVSRTLNNQKKRLQKE